MAAKKVFDIDDNCQPNAAGYDSLMYWAPLQEYYCNSDYVNYGYWEESTENAWQAADLLMEKLLAFVPEKKGSILDVACGKGATSKHLLQYYDAANITGINISETQLETSRKNVPECRFLCMDATDLKFESNSFDTVICVEAAFHFNTRQKFLEEAYRILKPGGGLVLSDILLTKEAEEKRRFRTIQNYVEGPQRYGEKLQKAGFVNTQVIDVTKNCFHGAYWHLIEFSHEKLLRRQMTYSSMRNFLKRVFEFVPEIRYYLLACGQKAKKEN